MVTCYKEIALTTRCACSQEEIGYRTYDQVVPCPEWVEECPGNLSECMVLLGSEAATEYVECAGDNEIPGRPGMVYSVSSAGYYEDVCCRPSPGSLPDCLEKITSYRGGKSIALGQAFYRDLYGQATSLVPVAPKGGICGQHITRQVVQSGNCCEGVAPLGWDTALSPEVMSPNSAVVIGVTGGGKYPYEWTVFGEGFQFQPGGSRRIITSVPYVTLSALPTACGMAVVAVSDGCTSVQSGIRCTSGRMQLLGSFSTIDYQQQLISMGGYLGRVFGGTVQNGDVTRWSADGRYWVGPAGGTPTIRGVDGLPFTYNMVQSIYGPWRLPGDGCLETLRVIDPLVGRFSVQLFVGCVYFNLSGIENGTYSWTAQPMEIWEWVC